MASSSILLIRQVIDEIWGHGDLDLADRLFTPTYVNHGGLIPDLIRGPESVKVAVVLAWHAFPGLRISVEVLLVDEQLTTVRWQASQPGVCVPHDRTNRGGPTSMAGLLTVRRLGDRIAESWTLWDRDIQHYGFDPVANGHKRGNGFAA